MISFFFTCGSGGEPLLVAWPTRYKKNPHRILQHISTDSVAQLVEQLTLNQRAESSSLSGVTSLAGEFGVTDSPVKNDAPQYE